MLNNIKKIVIKRIMKNGFIYFDLTKNFKKKQRAKLVVLAKNTYFETQKSFPITSISDIRNAIQSDMESYSPIEADLFFLRKIKEEDGNFIVNIWFVKKEAVKVLKGFQPVLIIPETLILMFAQKKEQVFLRI